MLLTAFKAVVYSNVWISLGAASLAFFTQYQLVRQVPISSERFEKIDWWIVVFAFFATHCSYSLQRYARHDKVSNAPSERHQWLFGKREQLFRVVIASGIAALASAIYAFHWSQWIILIPVGMISLLYAVDVRSLPVLRDIPFLKIIFIAFSWAILTGPLLLKTEIQQWESYDLWITLERFLFILAITIPFDVRDLPYDHPEKRTIPQIFGVQGAILIAGVLLLICFLLNLFLLTGVTIVGHSIGYLISIGVVFATSEKRPELFYSGLIDGLIILIAILGVLISPSGRWFISV